MLRTKCPQDLKGCHLSAFPRGSSLRLRFSSPSTTVPVYKLGWTLAPHTMVPPTHASVSKSIGAALCTPQNTTLTRARQVCQKYPRMPRSLPVGNRLPSVAKMVQLSWEQCYNKKRVTLPNKRLIREGTMQVCNEWFIMMHARSIHPHKLRKIETSSEIHGGIHTFSHNIT